MNYDESARFTEVSPYADYNQLQVTTLKPWNLGTLGSNYPVPQYPVDRLSQSLRVVLRPQHQRQRQLRHTDTDTDTDRLLS